MSSEENTIYFKSISLFTGIIALAIVVHFIHVVKPLILYLLFAYFLVTCFRGIVDTANKKFKMPEFVTYIILAFTCAFGISLFTYIITDTISELVKVQETYKALLGQRIASIESWITEIANVPKVDLLRSVVTEIPIQPILTKILNNTVSIFQVMFAFIIFMIAETLDNYARIADRLKIKETHFYEVMSQFQNNIQRYLVIKTFISTGTAIIVYLILLLFEVDFALLWAMLTFLFNYLPVIGSIVATIFPMIIVFVTRELGTAAIVLVLLTGNQIFWGQFLDPKLVGDEFNLKFKTILVSIFLWGSLLGIGGVILSPLLTLAIKLISEGHENWRWFSVVVSRRHDQIKHSPFRIFRK